jgi:hypothetical protein
MTAPIGTIRRVRFHNSTVALMRFENRRHPRPSDGPLRYPRSIWRRDEWLMGLVDLVQDLLSFDAGPVDCVPDHLMPEYRCMFRQCLAGHLARIRQ